MRRRDPLEAKPLRKKKLLVPAKVEKVEAVEPLTSLLLSQGKISRRSSHQS
jgi:hypothetical protein